MKDRPYDPFDETLSEQTLEEMAAQRAQQIEDVRRLISTGEGKRWFKRIAQNGYFFSTTMSGPNSVLNEGRRVFAIGCLIEVAMAAPEVCAQLLTELLSEEAKQLEESKKNERRPKAHRAK